MTGTSGESKGVAFTNWLVQKASGVLERKSSRRGFILGSAMVGSAVAVAGCAPGTQPGSPYNHITDCAGGLCTDGYTEFCCTINNGLNACPDGSFAGGWWRADYSSFCNGTRYYIDCMQNCCGPSLGNGFCSGCTECSCGGGCDTRRVYCNYFRYGQCHQEIGTSGPIACRVVTCTPPYLDASMACSTALAVDNSTAEHAPAHGCTPPPPAGPAIQSPAVGAASVLGPGWVSVFVRDSAGYIASSLYNGTAWGAWDELQPRINSGVSSAVDPAGRAYVFGRGAEGTLLFSRQGPSGWTGGALDGVGATSDPTTTVDLNSVHVAVRGPGHAVWHSRFVNGVWSGWYGIGGQLISNPSMIVAFSAAYVFGVAADTSLVINRWDGVSWSGWNSLGGSQLGSDPVPVFDGTTLHVFVRGGDGRVSRRRFNGTTWNGWEDLGGAVSSAPRAVAANDGVYVFARGFDGAGYCNRNSGGGWTGFLPLGGTLTTGITPIASGNGVHAICRSVDGSLLTGRFQNFAWSGWSSIGGTPSPLTALT